MDIKRPIADILARIKPTPETEVEDLKAVLAILRQAKKKINGKRYGESISPKTMKAVYALLFDIETLSNELKADYQAVVDRVLHDIVQGTPTDKDPWID